MPPFVLPASPLFFMVRLVGGNFQDSSGKPLSLGYLTWKLSHDSNVAVLGGNTGSQIISGLVTTIYLDVNGNALPNQYIWPNFQLTPEGSYYVVKAYNAQGLEVWGSPQRFAISNTPTVTFSTGIPVDLGTLQPIQP